MYVRTYFPLITYNKDVGYAHLTYSLGTSNDEAFCDDPALSSSAKT